MSEPTVERLSQFTPHAGKLDRHALLFAAGRASARPNKGWQVLSAVLASVQVLTFALLLPHLATQPSRHDIAEAPVPFRSHDANERVLPKTSPVWSVDHDLGDIPLEERIPDSLVLVDSEPKLRAFGGALRWTVN